jgi:hypothetical protein
MPSGWCHNKLEQHQNKQGANAMTRITRTLQNFTWFLMTVLCVAAGASAAATQDLQTRPQYHSLLSPDWSLRAAAKVPPVHPLYVVGMEKLSRKIAPDVLVHGIENDAKNPCSESFNCLELSRAPPRIAAEIRSVVTHPKVLWPTHIVQVRHDRSACALYSLYSEGTVGCQGGQLAPDEIGSPQVAFDRLKAAMTRDIESARNAGRPISHLVLLATGWNTFQDESAQNFADWAASLAAEGPATFNPIFVAISWQSTWGKMEGANGSVLSVMSFPNKSNDADEIGFTAANQLLNRYLTPIAAEHGLSILGIGHSFGTRILAAAFHGRVMLKGLHGDVSRIPTITFVALQPAFSVNRMTLGKKEAFYTSALPVIPGTRSFFTASLKDKATAKGNAVIGMFGKKPYISSPQLLLSFESKAAPTYLEPLELWKISCPTEGCSESARLQLLPPVAACARVPLIDATAVVNEGATASGAHSDVYDRAAAQLIFLLDDSCRART